jgi:hypothetical protein
MAAVMVADVAQAEIFRRARRNFLKTSSDLEDGNMASSTPTTGSTSTGVDPATIASQNQALAALQAYTNNQTSFGIAMTGKKQALEAAKQINNQ